MKSYFLAVLTCALAVTACKGEDSGRPAADNTKVNERDKDKTVTPMDQSNKQEDLDTTQKIRKALMADDTLSTDAKNIKVITNNGVVVLRGPVKSQAERTTVENLAKQNAGGNRLTNEVEVAAP